MTRQEKADGKIDINNLYFGIKTFSSSFSTDSPQELLTKNLFDNTRVKTSVAIWCTLPEERRRDLGFLSFCFGDVRGRAEWELLVAPFLWDSDKALKVDVYEMYVVPNRRHLKELVDSVAESTAKKYLAEERKRLRR